MHLSLLITHLNDIIPHLMANSQKTLFNSETKIPESANSVDLDEVALYEPPHLDLHCLPSSL